MRVALCCLIVAGCGGGAAKSVVGTGATTTMTIDSSGGQITLEGATLSIPAGALASATPITITSTTDSIPGYQQLSPIFHFEPDGLEFATPATLTLTTSGDPSRGKLLDTVHPAGPSVVWFQDLHGTANGHSVSASLHHFSDAEMANLPPCEKRDEDNECQSYHCGDHIVYDYGGSGSLSSYLLRRTVPIILQCKIHCAPCDMGTPGDSSNITFTSASGSALGMTLELSAFDAVANDLKSMEIVDTTKQFQWKLDGSTSTVSDLSGTPIFVGAVPGDAAIDFGGFGTLPSIAMTGTDTQNPDVVTVSGAYFCPGTSYPNTMTGGGNDMAMNVSGPAMITGVVPTRGLVGSPVDITVSGVNSITSISFNGVASDVTLFDGSTFRTHVPSGASSGFITLVADTGMANSVPTPFIILPKTLAVTAVSPTSAGPGAQVTLTGTNLLDLIQLTMDGGGIVTLPALTIDSKDTSLTFTVPSTTTAVSGCMSTLTLYAGYNSTYNGDTNVRTTATLMLTGLPPTCP